MKKLFYKSLSTFLIFCLFLSSIIPFFGTNNLLVKSVNAQDSCSAGIGDLRQYLSTRVGGVSLDQAAVFLADMSDITGAYYDADQDRVVLVGKKALRLFQNLIKTIWQWQSVR